MSEATTENDTNTEIAGRAKNDLLCVVEKACTENSSRQSWQSHDPVKPNNDNAGLRWYGARTPQVSGMLGIPVAKARYQLRKMEKSGVLVSHTVPGGVVLWWPVGFAEKLDT